MKSPASSAEVVASSALTYRGFGIEQSVEALRPPKAEIKQNHGTKLSDYSDMHFPARIVSWVSVTPSLAASHVVAGDIHRLKPPVLIRK